MVSFTPDQALAIQIDRHLAVEAGAGAGKTTVLVHRYLAILASNPKLTPSKILTITFTRKAAGELMERIHKAIHDTPTSTLEERIKVQEWKLRLGGAQIGTIHSFCTQILHRWGHLVGVDPQFRLIEDWEVRTLWSTRMTDWIHRAIRNQHQEMTTLLSSRSYFMVSEIFTTLFYKWDQLGPDGIAQTGPSDIDDPSSDVLSCFWEILSTYREALHSQGLMDFAHLQSLAVQVVREFPEVADQLALDHPFIMIDEFQDTDATQWELIDRISLFSSHPRCNVFVVGDIKQAIYGFRGSNTTLFQSVLDQFEARPDASVVRLTDNFRSTDPLIQFYNGLFAQLFHADAKIPVHYTPLIANRTSHTHGVEIAFVDSKSEEFERVAQWLLAHHQDGMEWNQLAVLCRKNAPLVGLASFLTQQNIPLVVMSNQHPLRSRAAQDLFILLRFLDDPTDWRSVAELLLSRWATASTDPSFFQQPHGSDENPSLDFLPSSIVTLLAAYQQDGLGTAVDQWLGTVDDPELTDCWHAMHAILRQSPSPSEGIRRIETEIRESKGRTGNGSTGTQLRLMTIHSAKGLEFDAVALMGCGERLISPPTAPVILGPNHALAFTASAGESSQWRTLTAADIKTHGIEEEKRTFYVGCTRAKEQLLLVGRADTEKKIPEVATCFFDFLLPHATILSTEVHLEFPVRTPYSTAIRMAVPRLLKNEAPANHGIAQTHPLPQFFRSGKLRLPLSPCVDRGGKMDFLSVSQLIRWMACSRQYQLSRVLAGFEVPDPTGKAPADTGIVVHRCLEHLLILPRQDIPSLVRQTASDLGILDIVDEVENHLKTTVPSDAFTDLIAGNPIPEYGFQLRVGTLFITGRIDCLSFRNDRWTITDFKTDRSPDTRTLPAHHRDQLLIYSLAIAQAKRWSGLIDMQVIYTRTGESVTVSCTHAEREAFAERLAQLPSTPFTPPTATVCKQCPVSQWVTNCRKIQNANSPSPPNSPSGKFEALPLSD
jgi:ATP-dependent exoDNAse (exonuclease V) beta subunit